MQRMRTACPLPKHSDNGTVNSVAGRFRGGRGGAPGRNWGGSGAALTFYRWNGAANAAKQEPMPKQNLPDIPYDKNLELIPGRVDEPMPGVRRLLCNNPSPFTFKGTVSYIVGRGKVAIVDPGPDDATHVAALLDAVRGETVTHILVTHTHRDHSPAVPKIKAATGAMVLAEGPHRASRALNVGEAPRLDASNDTDFRPDRALADGEVVSGQGWTIEAVTTPGHTANHMAFAYKEHNVM